MNAIVSFWNSERGILGIALIISATVLAALSVIASEQWLDYTKWIFATYVAGKSLTGAVEAFTKNKKPAKGGAS